jgi:hypothetical protein
MTRKALILAASLLAIGFTAGRSTSAQSTPTSVRGDFLLLTQPLILTGPDVGFQVVRMDGQIPVGQVVVRIDGVWVAADTSR